MTTSFDDDQLAAIAACSQIGNSGGDSQPLTPSEWNQVAVWLHEHNLRPAALLQLDDPLEKELTESHPALAAKLEMLPSRAGTASMELEQFEHRGIWAIARFDDSYPQRWREHLKASAPPVLFGAGPRTPLGQPSIAIVGSREIDDDLKETAARLGNAIAGRGSVMVSGGARGTDLEGMRGAIENDGQVIGILAGDLDRLSRRRDARAWISQELLTFAQPVHPQAGFSVGNAMGRNRLIYALTEATIVISTSEGSGGTWAGATDDLKRRFCPLLIWTGTGAPEANRSLVNLGGYSFDEIPRSPGDFDSLLADANTHWDATAPDAEPTQRSFLS